MRASPPLPPGSCPHYSIQNPPSAGRTPGSPRTPDSTAGPEIEKESTMTEVSHSQDPPPAALVHPALTDRSPWNWLLLIPIVLPLLTFLYNRETPRPLGFPFFFWFQLFITLLAAGVTAIVYLMTKPRS